METNCDEVCDTCETSETRDTSDMRDTGCPTFNQALVDKIVPQLYLLKRVPQIVDLGIIAEFENLIDNSIKKFLKMMKH